MIRSCRCIRWVAVTVMLALAAYAADGREGSRNNGDEQSGTPYRILLISPFAMSHVQYSQVVNAYISRLNLQGQSYYLEQLCIGPDYPEEKPEKNEEIQRYLRNIRAGKYQILVSFHGPGLKFLRREVATFPDSLKIIACELPPMIGEDLVIDDNIYYVFQEIPVEPTIELVARLFPERRTIMVLSHWNLSGEYTRRKIKLLEKSMPWLKFVVPDNHKLSVAELLNRIDALTGNSVIIFQGWYNDNAVNASSITNFIRHLYKSRPDIPIFVMHSSLLSFPTVGGCVVDGDQVGEKVADLTVNLVRNGKAMHFPSPLKGESVVKKSELRRFGVEHRYLPGSVEVLDNNNSISVMQSHREYIIIGSVCLVFLIIISVISVLFSVGYRRMLRRMRDLFSNMRLRILVADAGHNILLYNGGDNSSIHREYDRIDDITEEIRPTVKNAVDWVLESHHSRSVKYELNGRHYLCNFIPLPHEIFNRNAVLGVGIDIEEQHDLSLNEKIQIACLQAILPENNANISFSMILKMFCEHFGGDRCFLLQNDAARSQVKLVEEYCAEGIRPDMGNFIEQHSSDVIQWLVTAVHGHELVEYVPNCQDRVDSEAAAPLNRGAREWNSVLYEKGVRRMYTMQIYMRGQLWGTWGLVFHRSNGNLSETRKKSIPSIVRMIELILMRQEYINALARERDKAQSATKAKSAFLATMSHELRTPLNAVIGYSDLLAVSHPLTDEQREYSTGIQYAARTLLRLVNYVLDLSRIEAEQIKVRLDPVDLNAVFRELRATYIQQANAKHIDLLFEKYNGNNLLLDSRYMQQILVNLIGNAIKFTGSGQVKVCAIYENEVLSVAVSDTGCGIPEDLQAGIFMPFVQNDDLAESRLGSGLGLCIAKRLALLMDGDITVSSAVGRGSVFTLVLNHVQSSSAPAAVEDRNCASPVLRKIPRVLLVDDSPINIRVFEAMLKHCGIQALKANSGQTALEILSQNPVDIVFTDLRMPQMSGVDLLHHIRRMPNAKAVKVAVVTADILFNNENDEFDATLLKPVKMHQLVEVLQRLQ